ncbi:MAG: TerB family tellurite resistance protein [Phycisphaerae bacterium]|nr:TerB family tellurite resistance protein [Phycisphaerae bacterium]
MTGPFSSDAFEARRLGLEEEYFRSKDQALVGKLKTVFNSQMSKDELREASGITDDAVLERLAQANLRGELLTAFKLYPLVEIAWADGSVDSSEVSAILDAAAKCGVPKNGPAFERLQEWIKRGPTPDGRAAWRMYANELRKTLTPDELAAFRKDVLGYARFVAEASGGLLGIAFTISPAEDRVINEIAKLLSH